MYLIDPKAIPNNYGELSLLLRDKLSLEQFRAFEEIWQKELDKRLSQMQREVDEVNEYLDTSNYYYETRDE